MHIFIGILRNAIFTFILRNIKLCLPRLYVHCVHLTLICCLCLVFVHVLALEVFV